MTNFDYTCNYYYFTVQKPNKTKTNNMVDEKTKQNTHTQKKKNSNKIKHIFSSLYLLLYVLEEQDGNRQCSDNNCE